MAYSVNTRSYIGKGKFYLEVSGGTTGLIPVGNVSAASFAIEEDKKELMDYTEAGGGVADSVSRIQSVTGEMDIRYFASDNLALALRGTVGDVTSATVTAEAHTAYDGALVKFNFLPDPAVAPVVKSDDGLTTYVKDTDYTVSAAGIVILAAGSITNASTIKVDYTKNPAEVLQALTVSGQDYHVFFEGLNEADSGNPVHIDMYRVRFSPTSGLDIIGDDFGTLKVSFDVLKDSTVTGTGLSKFMTVTQAA